MNIAFTMAPGRGDTDLLLLRFATEIALRDIRASGTVQINTERDAGPCDMDVKVLPDGPVICISQHLGSGSQGCRLDPAALESAVGLVEASFAAGPDCLIVNKFGKHEAEGRGFRPLIAEALSRGIPVVVGLNHMNAQAFHAFTEGMAVALPPTLPALTAWFETCRREVAA
jgi:hypothetical protein